MMIHWMIRSLSGRQNYNNKQTCFKFKKMLNTPKPIRHRATTVDKAESNINSILQWI